MSRSFVTVFSRRPSCLFRLRWQRWRGDSPTQAVAGVSGDCGVSIRGPRQQQSVAPQSINPAARSPRGLSPTWRDSTVVRCAIRDSSATVVRMARTSRTRLQEAGVQFTAAAENLARVDASSNPAAVAHRELMASSSHRGNILGTGFNVIGVGVVQSGDTYWVTQIFINQ